MNPLELLLFLFQQNPNATPEELAAAAAQLAPAPSAQLLTGIPDPAQDLLNNLSQEQILTANVPPALQQGGPLSFPPITVPILPGQVGGIADILSAGGPPRLRGQLPTLNNFGIPSLADISANSLGQLLQGV